MTNITKILEEMQESTRKNKNDDYFKMFDMIKDLVISIQATSKTEIEVILQIKMPKLRNKNNF